MTRVALITGASSGLGLEFARQLDANPEVDEIWLIARSGDRLEQVANSLATPAIAIPADLSKPEDIRAVTSKLADDNLLISHLVNSAGFGRFGSWEAVPVEDEEAMIDLNCRALVSMTRACLPHMARGSRIIQVASSAGFLPLPSMNVYAASKAFVLRYSQALRFELRHTDIGVTALCPTWVDTKFEETARKSGDGQAVKHTMFAQSADVVVARALRASECGRGICCASVQAEALHLIGKIAPAPIAMAAWNVIRKL